MTKLLLDVAMACAKYQDETLRTLPCKRVQCDEIRQFAYAKNKNVTAESKEKNPVPVVSGRNLRRNELVPAAFVGDRSDGSAFEVRASPHA